MRGPSLQKLVYQTKPSCPLPPPPSPRGEGMRLEKVGERWFSLIDHPNSFNQLLAVHCSLVSMFQFSIVCSTKDRERWSGNKVMIAPTYDYWSTFFLYLW